MKGSRKKQLNFIVVARAKWFLQELHLASEYMILQTEDRRYKTYTELNPTNGRAQSAPNVHDMYTMQLNNTGHT